MDWVKYFVEIKDCHFLAVLWQDRNDHILSAKINNTVEVMQKVIQTVYEFSLFQNTSSDQANPCWVKWPAPPENLIALNVDASFHPDSNIAGIGGNFRDCCGTWKGGFMGKFPSPDNIYAELVAICQGLLTARHFGFRELTLHSDCLLAVQLVNMGASSCHTYASVIQSVQKILAQDTSMEVRHLLCEENAYADGLPRRDVHHDSRFSLLQDPPPELNLLQRANETLEEFSTKVKSMMDYLLRCMAKSLNLEEGSFIDQFGEQPLMMARFNFYPRCSRPDLVHGVKPHTDRSGITVLLQDKEVEGLQVLIDDKWVNVPSIPDALVVNLGDQMQIMSNGIFKSIMHKVVTNTEKMRMSVALFNEPEPENEIGPVEALIDDTRPRLYRNVKNYGDINYRCFQEGKIALETVKIADNSDQK